MATVLREIHNEQGGALTVSIRYDDAKPIGTGTDPWGEPYQIYEVDGVVIHNTLGSFYAIVRDQGVVVWEGSIGVGDTTYNIPKPDRFPDNYGYFSWTLVR